MNKMLYILPAIAFLGACGLKENTRYTEMKKTIIRQCFDFL